MSKPTEMTRFESLHNHTRASDGPYTYAELLTAAAEHHYGVMALTDHDVVISESDLAQLRSYAGPVKWISGIEISSGLPKELGGGPTSMFHIVGLFVDPTNNALREHCRVASKARIERMERIVKNLKSIGFKITVEDCLAESDGETVGRRNIANALERSPGYADVMDRLKRQMAEEAKEDPDVAMAYMRLLDGYRSDEPFKLFLSEDSYLGGIYVDYLYNVDMDTAVKLIRDAGGVAILAHWPTIREKVPAEMLEQMLRDKRLDGLELRSAFLDHESDSVETELSQMAERTGAAVTYGVDGHTYKDLSSFTSDYDMALRTVGQTQTLIDRFKPSVEFTNYSS